MSVLERFSPLLFLLMWSSGSIFVVMGLEYSSVSVFLTIRSVGAAFALLIMGVVLARKKGGVIKSFGLSKVLLWRTFFIGMLLQVGYQSGFFLALHYELTPGVLAVLLGIQPVLTPLLAREKIKVRAFLLLALGLLGLIIAVIGASEMGAVTAPGLFFGVVSVLAISTGTVMQKKSAVDPVISAFYQCVGASVIFLLVLPLTDIYLVVTPTFVFSVGWMAIVVSTLAVLLLFQMLARNSASKVGVLFYMVPIMTMLLDYAVFGNGASWITIGGALFVIAAVKGLDQHTKISDA